LNEKPAGSSPWPFARAPSPLRDDHRHRLVDHLRLERRALFLLDQRAAIVAVLLGVGFDLLDHQPLHRAFVREQLLELGLRRAARQFLSILIFSSRASWRRRISRMSSAWRSVRPNARSARLRLVRLADDADHLVDVQEDDHPAFEDVDAVVDLRETVAAAPRHRRLAELHPLVEDVSRPFWPGRPSAPIITRLIDAFDSRLVWASSVLTNSVWSIVRDFGSNTSRTARLARLVAHRVEQASIASSS
jgi:hypothetical protein